MKSFEPRFKDKLQETGTSIFAVMTKMATDYGAINVSQGFPNFNPPADLIEMFAKYQHRGENQYAPMPGTPVLRNAIAEKFKRCYGTMPDPDTEITITAGATQGLFTAFAAFVHPGDEVLLFEPAYDSYLPAIHLHGGVPVPIALTAPGFRIDWELTRSRITKKTKMVVINSPHNPCGSTLDADDIRQLAEITEKHGLLILSDEVYEHIIFDGGKHIALPAVAELKDKVIATYSFGKTYHATGWKTGYVVAPPPLTAMFRKVHQFVVFAVNTPAQHAYAEYLQREEHYRELPAFYQKKRDLFLEAIKGGPFTFTHTAGTYFQLLDYSAISTERDIFFAERLVKEAGVAVIPLSPFCGKGHYPGNYIRVCFAKSDDVLLAAAKRLKQA